MLMLMQVICLAFQGTASTAAHVHSPCCGDGRAADDASNAVHCAACR
jgi:hypothetical protein